MLFVTRTAIKSFSEFLLFLIIAVIMFTAKMPRRNRFVSRAVLSFAACVIIAVLSGFCGGTIIAAFYYATAAQTVVNIFAHIVIFASVFVAAYICFDKKPSSVLFLCIASYAVEHILSSITIPLSNYIEHSLLREVVSILIVLLGYVPVYFLFVRRFVRLFSAVSEVEWNSVTLFSVFIILIATVVGSIGYGGREASPLLFAMLSVCSVVFCFFLLYAQYLILSTMIARRDRETDKLLHATQLRQYEFIRNNIDEINIRFHDIKHKMNDMAENGGALDKDYIEKLNELISEYDSQIKTGSEALDVILLEKSLHCKRKKIKFICLADGALLDGMSPADLYSIFGNALDNAIEYLETVDEDNRIIKMYVDLKCGSFVNISIKNRFDCEKKTITGDNLKTSKSDADNHGYGIRSMKMTVERFGGSMSISASDDVFEVNIVLPYPVEQKK